ncbi:MAG: hypothetical protein KBT28_10235 [Bacteroidales bacterium]|nr:hypothetical protein [Candidatus Colimorpha merdihippi]
MKNQYQSPEIKLIEVSVESGYAVSHPTQMPEHGTEAFTNSGDEFILS